MPVEINRFQPKPTLLILAAGIGRRYGGLKQLEPVGPAGQTLLDYSIYDAVRAGYGKLVFTIRRDLESQFRSSIGGKYEDRLEVRYAYQELDGIPPEFSVPIGRQKPWGTLHATLVAEDLIQEPFTVINADDFYGVDAFRVMSQYFRETDSRETTECAMVGYVLRDTLSSHGPVARGVCEFDTEGRLRRIVERKRITRSGSGYIYQDDNEQKHPLRGDEVVSMNFWGFYPAVFQHLRTGFRSFLQENLQVPGSESFLPAVIGDLAQQQRVDIRVLRSSARWYGMTYAEDRAAVVQSLAKLVHDGEYPIDLWDSSPTATEQDRSEE